MTTAAHAVRSLASGEGSDAGYAPCPSRPARSRRRRYGQTVAGGEARSVYLRLVEELDVTVTPRQLECLKWAGEGKSSVDIGSILDISPATVNEHLADACRRLKVRTRIQAIVEAYRRGWLE